MSREVEFRCCSRGPDGDDEMCGTVVCCAWTVCPECGSGNIDGFWVRE